MTKIAFTKVVASGNDFVVIDKGKVAAAIQVAADFVDVKTKDREIKGLVQSCLKFDLTEGIILTLDHTEQLEQEGVKISVMPAWRYFLAKGI